MVFEIIIAIMSVYGLYFYIDGCKELSQDAKKNLSPKHIEYFTQERNQHRYFGQIILCIVGIYFMFILI